MDDGLTVRFRSRANPQGAIFYGFELMGPPEDFDTAPNDADGRRALSELRSTFNQFCKLRSNAVSETRDWAHLIQKSGSTTRPN